MLGLHPGRMLELSVRALTCIMVGMGVGVEITLVAEMYVWLVA